MQCIPVNYLGPISCVARNPAAKSLGVKRAARSGAYVDHVAPKFDRQLGRAAATIAVQSQSNWKQGKSKGFESCDWPIVRKRPIWVKIGDVLYGVTLKFDGWPCKTIGHLSFAVSSFVQHSIAIGEFKFKFKFKICLLSIHRDTTCIQLSTLCLIYTTVQSLSNAMEWKWGMPSGSQSRNHRPGPAVMVPALTLRPWDHTTQPRIGRPKMKLRTTDPQMIRSGPTQSRSTRIAVPAPAAKTTRPRCPIFPQAPRGMLHQRLTYDSNLA